LLVFLMFRLVGEHQMGVILAKLARFRYFCPPRHCRVGDVDSSPLPKRFI